MSTPPTMQTIADAAGYSRMTVSLALRNSPEIAEKTRNHIQKIAQELGYRPNPLISTLMAQRARKKEDGGRIPLAIINTFEDFDKFQNVEFYSQVLQGIHKRTEEHGFYGEVFHVNISKGLTPMQLNRTLLARGIRGVIILPMANPDQIFELDWQYYSVATIAYTWHGKSIHRAGADLFGNTCLLMENLYRQGFRRPGLFLRDYVHARTRGIEAGAYYLFQREHPELAQIPPLLSDDRVPLETMVSWLRQHQPDVVIGHGELGSTLKRLNPNLRKTFVYADLNLMPSRFGKYAGIYPRPDVMGEQAVDLAISRIYSNEFGLPQTPLTTTISGIWHDGESLTKGVV